MGGYLEIARRVIAEQRASEADRAANPDAASIEARREALRLLNRRGCRLILIGNVETVGVWPELDDREFHEALRLVGIDLPIRRLDDPTLPERYRTCRPEVMRLREAQSSVNQKT